MASSLSIIRQKLSTEKGLKVKITTFDESIAGQLQMITDEYKGPEPVQLHFIFGKPFQPDMLKKMTKVFHDKNKGQIFQNKSLVVEISKD